MLSSAWGLSSRRKPRACLICLTSSAVPSFSRMECISQYSLSFFSCSVSSSVRLGGGWATNLAITPAAASVRDTMTWAARVPEGCLSWISFKEYFEVDGLSRPIVPKRQSKENLRKPISLSQVRRAQESQQGNSLIYPNHEWGERLSPGRDRLGSQTRPAGSLRTLHTVSRELVI